MKCHLFYSCLPPFYFSSRLQYFSMMCGSLTTLETGHFHLTIPTQCNLTKHSLLYVKVLKQILGGTKREGEKQDKMREKQNNSTIKVAQHVDQVFQAATEMDFYIALWPIWGSAYISPGGAPKFQLIFDDASAYWYGNWIGQRYKDYSSILISSLHHKYICFC